MSHNIVLAFGTRPEATKMAPVFEALTHYPGLNPLILVTGQHRQQLDSALATFGLVPDADLAAMTDRQTLPGLAGKIVPAAAECLKNLKADYVLVHGDTLTTFCVAWAAFLEGIPVGHVEAGLRSGNLREPFPEEANRKLTDVIADLGFAPTHQSKENLVREGKTSGIFVTGQTAVDAIQSVARRAELPPKWAQLAQHKQLVCITMHRRENWPVLQGLAHMLGRLAAEHPGFHFIYPVHLNPVVRDAVWPELGSFSNVELIDPLDYQDMAALMKASALLVTDSGGLQEEGASLNVPVAVLRNVTERPEGLATGILKLVGNDPDSAYAYLKELLQQPSVLQNMGRGNNPYGDGKAGQRIAQAVAWRFGLADRPVDWEPPVILPS